MNGTKTTAQCDVLIVGAGLVGSAMATRLAASEYGEKLAITVIDPVPFKPNYSADKFDARVVALTEASRGLLDDVGIWFDIVSRACPFKAMEVREAEGRGAIEFLAEEVGQPALGHIVENSVIVEQLLGKFSAFSQINFNCPAKLVGLKRLPDASGYLVDLDNGGQIEAKLIIAADGANSDIRQRLDFGVREWSYGQDAIVSTIRTQKPHNNTARQWFTPNGPLAFLPLEGSPDNTGHHCSIVWSQDIAQCEELMALSDEEFCRQLSLLTGEHSGQVEACEKRFKFPLRQRHAIDYFKPQVALIGDAAHSIHPLAGQGVNLGFLDVLALSEALNWGLKAGLAIGDEKILQRFQRQRKPDNLRMMMVMEGFKRLFGSKLPLLRLIRSDGLSKVNQLHPVKNTIIRQAMGLG